MAKDKLRYRAARKNALGSLVVEKSIGITQLVSSSAVSPATQGGDEELAERPIGLMKWSFDDTIVEEVLPEGLLLAQAEEEAVQRGLQNPEETSVILRVVSEGVPDGTIEKLLRSRLPRDGVSFHFLTPVDFACCASRYVWVRGRDGRSVKAHLHQQGTGVDASTTGSAASGPELMRTPSGDVWVGPAQLAHVSCKAPSFPLSCLPRIRYTVVMRNVPGSLNSVLPRLHSLRDRGFLNYGHVARHGLGSVRAYEDGKALLRRDYASFLQHYAKSLSEGTPHVSRELHAFQDVLANARATQQDWQHVRHGVEMGLKQDREALPRWEQTGLYLPHHDMLRDFVTRASYVAPRHHDSAQVIREAVPRRVLMEKLRVVSEVHFNAQASLRWSAQRNQAAPTDVRVGDMVLIPNTATDPMRGRGSSLVADAYEGMADHIHGDMMSEAHQDWSYLAQEDVLAARADAVSSGRLKVVQTPAEAAAHSIDQVVLPLYGRGQERLPFMHTPDEVDGGARAGAAPLYHALVKELSVEGLGEMRTAPLATFRHLIRKPTCFSAYLCDEQRGWDWAVHDPSPASSPPVGSGVLKTELYKDQEGITRVRSPLMALTGKNVIARRGIRGAWQRQGPRGAGTSADGGDVRHHFLKPARKAGMLCVVRMELPRGSPVTSALREAFQFTTLSPSAIFHLLARR